MKKSAVYRVYGIGECGPHDDYIEACSAQEAVDVARLGYGDESYEVIDVAKLVSGWK